MSGTLGGVDASIPLRAGNTLGSGANNPNSFANNPLAFIDALTRMRTLQLLPGQMQLQQQELQSGQQTIESNAVKLMQQKAAASAGYLRTLLGQPNVSHDDVIRALGAAHGTGINTDALIARLASTSPADGNYRQFVVDNLLPSMGEQGALTALTPTLTTIPAGGQINVGQTMPLASGAPGQFRAQGTIPITMTPAEKAVQQPTLGPGNQEGSRDVGQTHDQYGNRLPVNSPLAGSLEGFNPTKPPPGFTEQATVTSGGNANQALALQNSATNLPMQKAVLGNLEAALTKFTAGPSAEWSNVAKSFANKINPFGNIFDPSMIASQDEFRKQALMLAQEQFKALHGTGTDAQLASTTHTSPNDFLSNLSNAGIIHFLKGNADAIGVMNSEWQKWLAAHGNDASTYGRFVTDFNQHYDPRVFQAQYEDGPSRQTMLTGLGKKDGPEYKKFQADYNYAAEHGWIPDG